MYIILYDRHMKRQLKGIEPILPASQVLNEPRGWAEFEDKTGDDYNTNKDYTLEELL